MNKREIGYAGETIVEKYIQTGYTFVQKNFTIRGGELDLIVENNSCFVFIEVKVVDFVNDLCGYITKRKIASLKKTIAAYRQKYKVMKTIRLDIVFIRKNKVFQSLENVTFW